MTVLRYTLILVLMMSVTGCVVPKLAIPVGTVDELTKDHAVVVIGVKALGGEKVYLSTSWQKYDATKQTFTHETNWQNRIFTIAQRFWGSPQDYGKLNYTVTKLVPGKYYLHFLEFQNSNTYPGYIQRHIASPYFKGNADKSLLVEALMTGKATIPMQYNYVIDVSPGEILYMGDFFVDLTLTQVKSIEIKNNLENARMAPKLHPSMRPLLKFQRPVDMASQN